MTHKLWIWAVLALFLCVLGAVSWAQAERIDALQERRKTLEKENTILRADLEKAADDARRAVDALEEMNASLSSRHNKATRSVKEIDDAPSSDDGAVAPVLRRALDGLRK